MTRVGAQIHLVITAGNIECLCEFARAGAKLTEIVNATASFHQFNPSPRLKCPNQNKAVRVASDEYV